MARAIDHAHPELPVTRTRWTRPAPPHDPRNRMLFSPSGEYLGFAAPASPATSTASTPEAEPQETE
jgi:hypothetical protein